MAKGLGDMMKQVQKMQAKMAELQEELAAKRVEGSAGGGVVKAVVTGKGELKEVKIDPEAIKSGDVEMLEEMIVSAITQAQEEANHLQQNILGQLTGGLNIPGLPF